MRAKTELQVADKRAMNPSQGEPTRAGVTWVPEVDIFEGPEAITVRADLPGAKKEAVDIDIRDGVLTLQACVEKTSGAWKSLASEYRLGNYARRFTLSDRIDSSRVEATMNDGVLTLVLPKAEAHKPRKIEIN